MDLFAQRLKAALELSGLSQSQLSDLTNIPKSAISQYISGEFRPKTKRMSILADALNVNLLWLYGFEGIPMEIFSLTPSKDLTVKEKLIIKNYRALNAQGKEKVNEYINDLLENPKYIATEDAPDNNIN